MDDKTFLKAVSIYRSNGGESACSPSQSCEGETPDTVILKDFDGHPVAEVSLIHGVAKVSLLHLASSSGSLAGNFCHAVAVLTLIGGLVGGLGSVLAAMDSYDPDYAGISFGLGVAASSAPIFAIGSIANSTKRSAKILKWMAEQENQRRAATPDT